MKSQVVRDKRLQDWPEFFRGLTNLLQTDERLRRVVAEQVASALPSMIWEIDAKRPAVQNAQIIHISTGIIQALEAVPETLKGLDRAPVETLVREYISALGGSVTAAPVLMELRKSTTFCAVIARAENAAGTHVAAYKTAFRKPGQHHDTPLHLALVFSLEAETVAAYSITRERDGIKSVPVPFGNGMDTTIANVLIDHSSAKLPEQEWVRPLAEKAAFALM